MLFKKLISNMNNMADIIDIRIGDVLVEMKKIPDKSIDVIITSPPYYSQRDYNNDTQWGNEDTPKEYIKKLVKWGNECRRVLKDSGSLFLNIGDKYNKKKSLYFIPQRVCLKFIKKGWCLRNNIVWYKPNHMPTSVKDRFTNTWESVYFFVKDS